MTFFFARRSVSYAFWGELATNDMESPEPAEEEPASHESATGNVDGLAMTVALQLYE